MSLIDIADESKRCPIHEIYLGLMAHQTLDKIESHKRESLLTRCRAWYHEADSQIFLRVHLVIQALKDIQGVAF